MDRESPWDRFELFMRISGCLKNLFICLVYNRSSTFYKATPSLIETTLSLNCGEKRGVAEGED